MNPRSDSFNKFSKDYDQLYLDHLLDFQEKAKQKFPAENEYANFYPSFGIKPNENCEFLIYGQATNGWRTGFSLKDRIDSNFVELAANRSNDYLKSKDHTPLDWVNVQGTSSVYRKHCADAVIKEFYKSDKLYVAYRSFFWQVIYKLISRKLGLDESTFDWSKHLVWSNLYKIAPQDENPDRDAKNWQLDGAISLVKQELKELKPKYCIVLTSDSWWAPFRGRLDSKKLQIKSSELIHSVEQYHDTRIVVCNRPRFGKSNDYVAEILKHLD